MLQRSLSCNQHIEIDWLFLGLKDVELYGRLLNLQLNQEELFKRVQNNFHDQQL